jgi:hypothetical protein
LLRETKLIASGSRSQPSSYQQTSDGSNLLRSTGGSWTQNWDGWQRLVGTAQAIGKDFVGITYGASGDTHAMTFGKASFLLDWKGGGGAFIYETVDGSDPANNAWTTSIGQPLAAKHVHTSAKKTKLHAATRKKATPARKQVRVGPRSRW